MKARVLLGALLLATLAMASELPRRQWTARAYPATFERISVAQGLSQSTVPWSAQDRLGFLWFATRSGLNRYDGEHFLVFRQDKDRPDSLASNVVNCLLVDRRGLLWVGTPRGVNYIDPETLVIKRLPESGGTDCFAEDPHGNLWMGTEKGLSFLPQSWMPPAPPVLRLLEQTHPQSDGPPIQSAYRLLVDSKGALWTWANNIGLHRIRSDASGERFTVEAFPVDRSKLETAMPDIALCLAEDAFGMLWLGGHRGLTFCDPEHGVYRRYTHDPRDPQSMGGTVIFGMHLDHAGVLWIANDGGGLSRMLPRARPEDTPRFQRFQHDPKDPHSLSSNGLQFVFEDRSGVLWVSAYQAGLNKLVLNPGRKVDPERPSIFQFRNNPLDATTLTGDLVSAAGEDRFGNLWVGTDGSGLNRLRPSLKPDEGFRFDRYRAQAGKAGALQGDVILAIHLDSKQRLWLGTYDEGLVLVDQRAPDAQPLFTHFKNNPKDPAAAGNFIWSILEAEDGRLWLGTNDHGLNQFDPRTRTFKRFFFRKDGHPGLWNSNAIVAMAKDVHGTLWLATPDGLNRFNPRTGECRGYLPGGPGTLGSENILTLRIDGSGRLWVGTSGGGLSMAAIPPWEGPAPTFTNYTTREGLPSNVVNNIQEADGQLWLGTDRHLCRFDPSAGRAIAFTWEPELQKAEFLKNASFRNASGELLFGSNDGLTLFHPQDIVANPVPPPIAITDFQVMNRSLPLQERMPAKGDGKGGITLQPRDTVVSFDFAALHYAAPEQNRYATMLEGLNQSWKEGDSKRSVSYSTLPAGDYVLRVRASNCDGVWNEEGLRLKIKVLPLWYRTWWFRGLIALLLGGAVVTFVRVRLEVVQARNRHLEEVVATRTLELQEANEALKNQSLTDPLTGLRNRRFLSLCMPEDVAQVAREQQDVAMNRVERMKLNIEIMIIMVDMDHFKFVNDTYGHLAGDKVLQQLSAILKDCARTSDTVTRWGGEEFLIIARHAARVDATVLPERIRAAVEAFPFDIDRPEPLHRTCSIGFSVFPLLAQETGMLAWEKIVEIADSCLYAAKKNGRNAWVGIVPDADLRKDDFGGRLPTDPAEIARSGLFPIITSLAGSIDWKNGA